MKETLHRQIKLLLEWDTAMKKILHRQIKLLILILLPILIVTSCYRATNAPVRFYGLVLDEDGNPLSGVRIPAVVRGRTILAYLLPIPALIGFDRTVHRKTNSKGRFHIKGYYGDMLMIDGLVKNGYEWKRVGSIKHFDAIWDKSKMPDPNAPIVYRMRKIGETTFVLDGQARDISASFNTDDSQDNTAYFDITGPFRLRAEEIKTMRRGRDHTVCDLRVTGQWEESESRWAVTFAPGTANGGIQILNQMLYMAPETGYKPEVTFYLYMREDKRRDCIYLKESPNEPFCPEMRGIERRSDDRYYIYLKSRDSELYSRIALLSDRIQFNRKQLVLKWMKVTTNPFAGQRSLDMRQNIPSELKIALRNEIQQTFRKDPNAIITPPDWLR